MSHHFHQSGPPYIETCVLESDMLYAEYVREYLGRQQSYFKNPEIQNMIRQAMLEMFARINELSARAPIRQ